MLHRCRRIEPPLKPLQATADHPCQNAGALIEQRRLQGLVSLALWNHNIEGDNEQSTPHRCGVLANLRKIVRDQDHFVGSIELEVVLPHAATLETCIASEPLYQLNSQRRFLFSLRCNDKPTATQIRNLSRVLRMLAGFQQVWRCFSRVLTHDLGDRIKEDRFSVVPTAVVNGQILLAYITTQAIPMPTLQELDQFNVATHDLQKELIEARTCRLRIELHRRENSEQVAGIVRFQHASAQIESSIEAVEEHLIPVEIIRKHGHVRLREGRHCVQPLALLALGCPLEVLLSPVICDFPDLIEN